MLPNIQSKDRATPTLVLKLHKCAQSVSSLSHRSASVPRPGNVVVLDRKNKRKAEDKETEAVIAMFEKSLKTYDARRAAESLRRSSIDQSSPDLESRRRSMHRISVFRNSVGNSAAASPLLRGLYAAPTKQSSPRDEAFIDKYFQHPAHSRAVNRLPLPGSLDFDYKSADPLKPFTHAPASIDAQFDDLMSRDKRIILNLFPNEDFHPSSLSPEKPAIPLFDGFQLFWSVRSTAGDKPEAREAATMCWLGRKVYLFGGLSMVKRNDVRCLNTDTWSWSMVSAQYIPKGRIGHTMVGFRNTLVVYGGWSHYSQRLRMRRCYKKVFVLHIDGEVRWQRYRGVGQAPKARRYHCAAALGTTMVLFGGIDMRSKVLHSLVTFDMDTQTWQKLRMDKHPGPVSNSSLTAVFHSTLLDRWDFSLFSMPKLKIEQVMANSGFYLFGGLNKGARPTNLLWLLELTETGMQWRLLETKGVPPSPRSDHSAVLLNTFLFIYGGKTEVIDSPGALSMLRIDNLTWERIMVSGSVPPPRWSHCAVGYGSKMIVWGGICSKTFQPADMYVLETEQAFATELSKQHSERQLKFRRML